MKTKVEVTGRVVKKQGKTKKPAKKQGAKKKPGKGQETKPQARRSTPAPRSVSVKRVAAKRTRSQESAVFYRLNAFLHTLRVIAGYEDQLCTLLHASRPGTAPDAETHRELLSLLEEMPATHYQQELEALREALLPSPAVKKRVRAR